MRTHEGLLPVFCTLIAGYADPLPDVVPLHRLVYKGDGIVRIADNALPFGVEGQLLAAEDVSPRPGALGPEVSGRADIGPAHILTFTQLSQRLGHCSSKGLEGVRKVRPIGDTGGMLPVDIEASGAADHQQPGLCAGKDVAQML